MVATKKPSQDAIGRYALQINKALGHLEYSHKKAQKLPMKVEELDDDQLETWESFSSRFSRVVDLFLTKYIKAVVFSDDPGFSGTVRDYANYAERIGLIDSADRWMEFRELRNIEAHTYEDDLERFLVKLKKYAPEVLARKLKLLKK